MVGLGLVGEFSGQGEQVLQVSETFERGGTMLSPGGMSGGKEGEHEPHIRGDGCW